MDEMNCYRCRDIFLASFLLTNHKRLVTLKPERGAFWFLFADRKSCEKLAQKYVVGDSKVPIRRFISSFRSVKDILFMEKRRYDDGGNNERQLQSAQD